MKLSDRMSTIKPSATLAVAARAAKMKREGVDIISLTLGEPDFPTVPGGKAAAHDAIDKNYTRYTAVKGIPELVEAVAGRTSDRYGFAATAEMVVVSSGAKQCLYDLAVSLWQEGDEILIFSPYWVSYPDQAKLVGASTVTVRTSPEDGFRIPMDDVRAAITDRTKAMIINNPSNPSGAVLPREDVEGLAKIACEHDLMIIADAIYDPIVYDGVEAVCPLSLGPEVAERTALVHGVSKAYAMTGWRIGWLVAPPALATACTKVQGQCTSNPSSVSQYAALGALTASQAPVDEMVATYAQRRTWLLERMAGIPGLHISVAPQGAFYLFPQVTEMLGRTTPNGMKLNTSVDVSEYILMEGKVASVPGAAFGEDSCIRFSYAASMDELERAFNRIEKLLAPWV